MPLEITAGIAVAQAARKQPPVRMAGRAAGCNQRLVPPDRAARGESNAGAAAAS